MIIHWGLPNMMTGYAAQKGGIAVTTKFQLIPGNNEIPDTDWEEIKKHPLVGLYIKDGVIKEVTKPEKDNKKSGDGVAKYSLDEAKGIIKDTFDLRLLKSWAQKESRDAVQIAIANQIKSVEESTKKTQSADDDDEE